MARKGISRIWERVVEAILMLSGSLTTFIIILIIIFLFKEGFSLFNTSPVENENILVVNKNNPVNNLNAAKIKSIFDGEITNWKKLGGNDDTIEIVTVNEILNYYTEDEIGSEFEHLGEKIDQLTDSIPGLLGMVPGRYKPAKWKSKLLVIAKNNIPDFIEGREWFPTAEPAVQLGVLPLITGTLLVSFFAILFALPIGIAAAIYLAEVADERIRRILKPIIELLAGIPSVVYGFFGLIVIVPLIHDFFNLPVGETALAGSIVLAIMALPTIITVSEDAIRTTPKAMKEASLALGATRWQTIYKVILPYSLSGISAAAILGIGRAIGETMAVLMVTGNAALMPHTLLQPVRTIPATIAAELGEAPAGGVHYKALFALGCLLFIMTLIINITVQYILSKRKMAK